MEQSLNLPPGKKIYFASDFHLGVPTHISSLERERKIVAWLDKIRHDAAAIYLLGDIFDFWFEYRHTIPKGYIRMLGKLAELRDAGIEIAFFTGNHDMWMFDYFPSELGIPVHRKPIVLTVGTQRLLMGHGDGLGPGEHSYKLLKKFFDSKVCQWLFARIHPNLGMQIATFWSKQSRISNSKNAEQYLGDDKEFLLLWCKEQESMKHHDFYIFGHRHLVLDIPVTPTSRYINLGEWVHDASYAMYDGQQVTLRNFNA